MPWKETEPMDEKERFVTLVQTGRFALTDLCRDFGISRKTGHKYLDRYSREGRARLKERSRRPKSCSFATEEEVERLILLGIPPPRFASARKLRRLVREKQTTNMIMKTPYLRSQKLIVKALEKIHFQFFMDRPVSILCLIFTAGVIGLSGCRSKPHHSIAKQNQVILDLADSLLGAFFSEPRHEHILFAYGYSEEGLWVLPDQELIRELNDAEFPVESVKQMEYSEDGFVLYGPTGDETIIVYVEFLEWKSDRHVMVEVGYFGGYLYSASTTYSIKLVEGEWEIDSIEEVIIS